MDRNRGQGLTFLIVPQPEASSQAQETVTDNAANISFATSAAVMVFISVDFCLLGIDGLLQENDVDLNLNALLIMSAVIGFSGSFISLALSRWMAKRTMDVRIIGTSTDRSEQWLRRTIECLARDAGIGMSEVGIFDSLGPDAFATGINRNNALCDPWRQFTSSV